MDYASNSIKSRAKKAEVTAEQPKKEIKKIASAKPKKKSKLENFFGNDLKTIIDYIGKEVIIPAAKKMLVDAGCDAISMLFYGDTSHSAKRPTNYGYGSGVGINYTRFSSTRGESIRPTARYSNVVCDDIILQSKDEANMVIDSLCEVIETYGWVSVADMHEMVGMPVGYTEHKYGWNSLRTADIIAVREGYMIRFPAPRPLD